MAERKHSPIPARAGVGLRFQHQSLAASGEIRADWFEVHAENYMRHDSALNELRSVARHVPISLHAVGLSLGSADGVDPDHLRRFNELVAELNPGLISDHLSWSRVSGTYLPDLLPLPCNDEALSVFSRNLEQVQRVVGRQMLIENPSTYLQPEASRFSEAQFLAQLVQQTGCGVLLDINNVFVSASNRGLSPGSMLDEFLTALNIRDIGEIHLAGHTIIETENEPALRVDDHGSKVCAGVWSLYEHALRALGPKPTLIEWDTNVPEFDVLAGEAALAQRILDQLPVRHAIAV